MKRSGIFEVRRLEILEPDRQAADEFRRNRLPGEIDPILQDARRLDRRDRRLDRDSGRRHRRRRDLADRLRRVMLPEERERERELGAGRFDNVAHAVRRRRRREAANHARAVVDRFNLEQRIRAIHGAGEPLRVLP